MITNSRGKMEKYILITNKGCSQCEVAKKWVDNNNLKDSVSLYNVSILGLDLPQKYNITSIPRFIELSTDRVLTFEEFQKIFD